MASRKVIAAVTEANHLALFFLTFFKIYVIIDFSVFEQHVSPLFVTRTCIYMLQRVLLHAPAIHF